MLVRLKESGSIDSIEKKGDTEAMIERRAMLVYAGTFQSMDGEVIVKKSHIHNLVKNHNSLLGKVKRLANGMAAMKNYPPIQLDHSTSARDTIGRLVGDLEVADYEDDEGKKVSAVYGNVRILGKDNVERINDGRWTHLSIGADFEKGSVSELTVTPFPAAKNASLLKVGRAKDSRLTRYNYKGYQINIIPKPSGGGTSGRYATAESDLDSFDATFIDSQYGFTDDNKAFEQMKKKIDKRLDSNKKMSFKTKVEISSLLEKKDRLAALKSNIKRLSGDVYVRYKKAEIEVYTDGKKFIVGVIFDERDEDDRNRVDSKKDFKNIDEAVAEGKKLIDKNLGKSMYSSYLSSPNSDAKERLNALKERVNRLKSSRL